jgi:transcriptional regulator with XRE-family HTH domain
MASATKARNERTFRSGDYIAGLMAELSKAAITQRVAAKREQSGLTQHEVAELMNVTPRTIQYWESQTNPIVAFDRLDELAQVIGTTKFWLLHGAELPGSAEDAASLAEILRRLGEIEAKVDGLPTAADLKRGLDTLRKAIDAQASRGTRRARKTGTDGP